MSYGLRYRFEFDSLDDKHYLLELSKKNYSGLFENLTASSVPIVQEWLTDNPKEPVRGSSLSMKYVNIDNLCPLVNFLSEEDDTWQVGLYFITSTSSVQPLFFGYLMQDDCREDMLDTSHEITLTATDNLGLLKDTSFIDAANTLGNTTSYGLSVSYSSINSVIVDHSFYPFPIAMNDHIAISGTGTAMDGRFTVMSVVSLFGTSTQVNFTTNMTAASPAGSFLCVITVSSDYDLPDYITYAELLRICLLSTGLQLHTRIYAAINENNAAGKLLESIYERTVSYSDGNTWKSCYDIVSSILFPLRFTLFQSEGYWNIVRWDELRYWNKHIPGYEYSKDFVFIGDISLDNTFTVGFEQQTFPVSAPEKSVLRPYKFVKETFKYSIPELLKNRRFDLLGALIRTYAVGSDTIKEYETPFWSNGAFAPFPQRFIRVTTDTITGAERERVIVTKGTTGDIATSAKSADIEVSAGDRITFSYSTKTIPGYTSFNGAAGGLRLTNGSLTRWVHDDGNWLSGAGATIDLDDSSQWQQREFVSKEIPFDGIVNVFLPRYNPNDSDEVLFKDLNFEYILQTASQVNVIGHTHTQTHEKIIKNNEDVEILTDDSPRNPIGGTLFLDTYASLVRSRTLSWSRNTGRVEAKKLGEIVTYEQLYHRRISRTKVEGTFYRLVQNDVNISPLTLISHTELPGLWFTIGALTIDYRNDNARINMLEMATDTEIAGVYDEIGRNTVAIQATSPHTLGVSTSLTVPINIGDRVTVVGSSVAGSYTVESFSTVGSFIQIIVTETIGTYSGPALVIISRRNYNENFGQTYEFKYIYK